MGMDKRTHKESDSITTVATMVAASHKRESMARYDEVLKEAMETSSKERSQQAKENAACGYLAQWVVQLELDLKEVKENYLAAISRSEAT